MVARRRCGTSRPIHNRSSWPRRGAETSRRRDGESPFYLVLAGATTPRGRRRTCNHGVRTDAVAAQLYTAGVQLGRVYDAPQCDTGCSRVGRTRRSVTRAHNSGVLKITICTGRRGVLKRRPSQYVRARKRRRFFFFLCITIRSGIGRASALPEQCASS